MKQRKRPTFWQDWARPVNLVLKTMQITVNTGKTLFNGILDKNDDRCKLLNCDVDIVFKLFYRINRRLILDLYFSATKGCHKKKIL